MAMIKAPPNIDDESMYADESPTAQDGEDTKHPRSEDEGGEEEGPTAVIDIKVLTGPDGTPPKEGDEIVLKVVKLFGDNEAEVAYAPKEKKPARKSDSYEDELDAMSKES